MKRIAALSLSALAFAFAAPAIAQAPPTTEAPQNMNIDERGVDIITGKYYAVNAVISIGDTEGGVTYEHREGNYLPVLIGSVRSFVVPGSPAVRAFRVTIDGRAWTFRLPSTTDSNGTISTEISADEDPRTKLTRNVATVTSYTLRLSDGAIAVFNNNMIAQNSSGASIVPPTGATATGDVAYLISVTRTDGASRTITHTRTIDSTVGTITYYRARIDRIDTNSGYRTMFTYLTNSLTADWWEIASVKLVNMAVDDCLPSCNAGWPQLTRTRNVIGPMVEVTLTDNEGRIATVSKIGTGSISTSDWSGASATVTLTSDRVTSWTDGSGTYYYGYSDLGSVRTTTVTNPASHMKIYKGNTSSLLLISVQDETNRTTSYTYHPSGLLRRITQPGGYYTEYTYDARGRTTKIERGEKPPGTGKITVWSATYPADLICDGGSINCHKPLTTKDGNDNTTSYTYSPTHGGLTTVTSPAVNGVQQETRYAYTNVSAWYYAGGSGTRTPGAAIAKLASTSTCGMGNLAACVGTADEIKTTITYQTGSATVGANILPISVKDGGTIGGTAVATSLFAYDDIGNVISVDGPLSGTADTTRYQYDGARRLVRTAGPDPDGAGPLKHRAVVATYANGSMPWRVEAGTVTDLVTWADFSMLEKQEIAYHNGRPVRVRRWGATGPVKAITDFSYDFAGRIVCTTERMNPAVFGSLPSGACTHGTTGANGPDKILRRYYDFAGRMRLVLNDRAAPAADVNQIAYTFNANGSVATQLDGKANTTTYEYDTFGRLKKKVYPDPLGTGASSTTNWEEFAYDNAGNITDFYRRDGGLTELAYDERNRLKQRIYASVDTANYTYDNFGRMKTANMVEDVFPGLTWTYDQLGRMTAQGELFGTTNYAYDEAGNRTRVTWKDNHYFTYTYDATGAMKTVTENVFGGASTLLATYEYDNLGRRVSLARGTGTVTTTYEFDDLSRLEELTLNLNGTTNDVTKTFDYNQAGQIIKQSVSNSGFVWPSAPDPIAGARTVNPLNQLTSAGGGAVSPIQYHLGGGLIDDGTRTFEYDLGNRLREVDLGATHTDIRYDPLDRVFQVQHAVTTRYVYDGGAIAAEFSLAADYPILRRWVRGAGQDEVLVWYEGSGLTDRRYLVSDERGSIVAASNSAGNLVAGTSIVKYDEYGRPTGWAGRFAYTGQYWFSEVELYYYKARFYHPKLQRFLQPDPLGYKAGMNLYGYTKGDPMNRTDPWGLCDYTEPGAGECIDVTASRGCYAYNGCYRGIRIEDGGWWSNWMDRVGAGGSPSVPTETETDTKTEQEKVCEQIAKNAADAKKVYFDPTGWRQSDPSALKYDFIQARGASAFNNAMERLDSLGGDGPDRSSRRSTGMGLFRAAGGMLGAELLLESLALVSEIDGNWRAEQAVAIMAILREMKARENGDCP